MRIIDADTHIDETDATWEYMSEGDCAYKPTTAFPSNPDPKLPPARYWVIDGKRQSALHSQRQGFRHDRRDPRAARRQGPAEAHG